MFLPNDKLICVKLPDDLRQNYSAFDQAMVSIKSPIINLPSLSLTTGGKVPSEDSNDLEGGPKSCRTVCTILHISCIQGFL